MANQTTPGVQGRQLKDFAHLFLGRQKDQKRRPSPRPREQAPQPSDKPLIAFLGGGDGWLRTFLTAEIALVLAEAGHRLQVIEEGTLFPTVTGHLGRWLRKSRSPRQVTISRGGQEAQVGQDGPDCTLVEIPDHRPGWAQYCLSRCNLVVLVVADRQVNRIRAFQQLKELLTGAGTCPIGVVMAEEAGSGKGRQAFHRFLSALPREAAKPHFLGTLPVETRLDQVILPERKPAMVWFPESLTAAALTRAAAEIRRVLPLEQGPC